MIAADRDFLTALFDAAVAAADPERALAAHLPARPKGRICDGKGWEARCRAMRELWGWVLSSRRGDGSRRAENAEQAMAWLRDYFAKATENDFVMGRARPGNGHETWRCDIDYLLSAKGLKQVLEKTVEAA